ncbi:hypothetical protein SNEBB_011134 [Seison nebaliae]|nr:hypothetical protein SNEBB_011134 [Seison nebaliae]
MLSLFIRSKFRKILFLFILLIIIIITIKNLIIDYPNDQNETSSIINNHENLYKNVIRHINSSYDNKENLWYSEIGKECNNSKNVDKFYFGNYSKNPLKKKIVNTILQPFNLPAILFFDDEKDDFKIKGIDFDDLRRRRINKYLLIIVHTGRLERYELRQTILEKIVSKYSAINGFLIRITYVVGLIQNEDWKDYTKISELYYQSQFFQVNTLSFEEFVINHGKHVTVNSFKVLPLILKVSSYSSYLVLNVTEEYRNMVVKHVSWINWFNRYFSSSTLSNIMKRQQMKNSNTFLKPFYNLNGRIDWKYKFIQPDFILKIDDDVIPNIRLITKSLQERQTVYEQTHHDVTCLTIVSGNALRGGKWKATCEEYPFKTYPHYCIGYGYLAKPVYIKSIAILSYYMREFWIDDVLVTGIMRHRLWYQLNKGQHEKKNSQQLHLVPGTKEFPIFRRCSLVLKDAKNISMAKRKCANSFFHTSEIAIPKSLVNVLYELY